MNQRPEPPRDPETLRSEIDQTRQRMDHTIDELGRRLKGRHLLDEVLGLVRNQQGTGNMTKLKEKITHSTDTAYHTVVDTIKAHPVPTALIGAGIAWMIYEKTRAHPAEAYDESEYGYDDAGLEEYYAAGSASSADMAGATDYPDERVAPPGGLQGEGAAAGSLRPPPGGGRMQGIKDGLRRKASAGRQRLGESAARLRERGGEAAHAVGERARRLYDEGRHTVEEHPLQSGLACLAIGVIAGLLIPTPRRVREKLGPKVHALRDRAKHAAQDVMERGKHVVAAAADAARAEAEEQGLTPHATADKAHAVADKTREAAKSAAEDEALASSSTSTPKTSGAQPKLH